MLLFLSYSRRMRSLVAQNTLTNPLNIFSNHERKTRGSRFGQIKIPSRDHICSWLLEQVVLKLTTIDMLALPFLDCLKNYFLHQLTWTILYTLRAYSAQIKNQLYIYISEVQTDKILVIDVDCKAKRINVLDVASRYARKFKLYVTPWQNIFHGRSIEYDWLHLMKW